jgi:enoyl-CoA hydratase
VTDAPLILSETRAGVTTLTVNRPERRNALSRDAWLALLDEIRRVRDDSAARAVVVTGAGDRAFAAGADVAELVDREPLVALEALVAGVLQELEDLPVPTVAAVNGHALGGGFELALACDLRIAVEDALVGFPEVGLGIMPGAGGIRRLLHHVGLGRAKELVMSGRLVDARAAEGLGIINRVVERARLEEATAELLDGMLDKGPLSVRLAKLVLNATASGTADRSIETLAYTLTFYSEDRAERMRTFLEQRPRR